MKCFMKTLALTGIGTALATGVGTAFLAGYIVGKATDVKDGVEKVKKASKALKEALK